MTGSGREESAGHDRLPSTCRIAANVALALKMCDAESAEIVMQNNTCACSLAFWQVDKKIATTLTSVR